MTDGVGDGAADPRALVREDELVELTCALVDAAGENPGGTEQAVVDVLERACRERGFDVTVSPVVAGRPNLVATLSRETTGSRGDGGPGLLFLGHSDVVPAGPGWTREPFAATVDDGRVYGRGSTDMKGGLAAVVIAMAAVRAAGIRLSGPVTLACTVDEEDLGLGIRALVADPAAAGMGAEYLGCVVAEPTDLGLVVGCRGDSYLEMEVTGVPAHSGRPGDGRNAIDAASRILELVRADHERLAGEGDALLGPATWNVGRISGGRGSSIVAPDAHVWLDRRLLPEEDPDAIAADLARRIEESGISGDGIGVEITVTMEMPGFRTPDDHPFVRAVHAAGVEVGLSVPIGGWSAACDGGFVARDLGIPAVVAGPGGLNDQAHQVDESVGIDELVDAARWYASLIVRLLGAAPAGA
ncbi:M20 family metallopeptidase [Mobilicoccus massiliensis]|uniref:M20 family metallopeptidase n=1 Tax=Mobilicoccus massiliensis TaxID=1522310 RepID=UPI000590A8B3|nr:M20 family metallopeptidase [Mobilicoccus massiliensis]